MGDADIFNAAVADRGGRLDSARLPPIIAEGLNYASGRASGFLRTAAAALPGMPPIYFDFIDNWEFNAVALKHDGKYFIGVYRGALATLSVLFDRMLGDPRILPFVGKSEDEEADLPNIPAFDALRTDFIQALDAVPAFRRPRNPARQSFARKMVDTAFDFLLAHEFAHIANGHIDFYANRGISAIDEAAGVAGDMERMLISQTIEMDADDTAVLISLGSEWRKIAGKFRSPSPPWADSYRYPGQVSLFWSYAVSSLCRIFGDTRLTCGDVTLESYPRWRLRSAMIQQATGRVPRPPGLLSDPSLVGDEPDRIPKTIKVAHSDVEDIFVLLTGIAKATEGLDDAWGDVGKSQMNRLRDYWRTTLKRELLEFAHQPLSSFGGFGEQAANLTNRCN
jgi:hypothetical protein